MKYSQPVGIVSYGTALPALAIQYTELFEGQKKSPVGVVQKTVPELDQDTVTLATDASIEALSRCGVNPLDVSALFVGSESHPYAVKPTGTIVASALGISNSLSVADLEFACKAGTQALQISVQYVTSGMSKYALAVGADTAQAKPGDALEMTASAGAAAFVVGSKNCIAEIIATTSYATDTPDFWRRDRQPYPEHAGRFTGEPAYFEHITQATHLLLNELGITTQDIDYCVFHTPNSLFPVKIATRLGFTKQQIEPSLVVTHIGNTYSAATPLALSAVLDIVEANKTILVTSYGSGSGSDSFLLKTTPKLIDFREKHDSLDVFQTLQHKINNVQSISYSQYVRHMRQHA